ncbi:MAG TPA: hypothetical protein VF316_03515 [Polyangiaceae bacterium]
MSSGRFRRPVSFGILLVALCSGCVWGGGAGVAAPTDVAGLKPGCSVEITSVEATTPNRASDVTVSGEVRQVTGDTLYLADGQALPRGSIVSVRQLSMGTSFFHDVAMGALAGLAMHVAINGLSPGFH